MRTIAFWTHVKYAFNPSQSMFSLIAATNSTVTQSAVMQSGNFDLFSQIFTMAFWLSVLALIVSYYSYKEAKRLSDITEKELKSDNKRFLLNGWNGRV